MILISYDGSADAQAALDHAAELVPGAEAGVLCVWRPFAEAAMFSGGEGMGVGLDAAYTDPEALDAASRQSAQDCANAGAERAVDAGLAARPLIAPSLGNVARTVLSSASQLDAEMIVLGTRGLTGARSFFMGSVSHDVLQHSDRPVVVVPAADTAEQRRAWFLRETPATMVGA